MTRQSRSYWSGISLHSDAAKDALRSWFMPLADDMIPYKGEVLCDVETDRDKKLRAFMVGKDGKRYVLTRTRGSQGNYSVTIKAIPEHAA